MSDSTTLTVRTKKHVKKKAQAFFDGLGLSLSAGVNMFLADVAHNQRICFNVEKVVLT